MPTETAQAPTKTGGETGTRTEGNGPASPDAAKAKGFAKARELAGKLKGMLRRDNNPESALKNLKDLRESNEAPRKPRSSEVWTKATKRGVLRRHLSTEAATWQQANKDTVDAKYNTLKGDRTDLTSRERFQLRAQAITESMSDAGVDPKVKDESAKGEKDKKQKEVKLTRKIIKNSEEYKNEVNQRLDIMTSEKGRPVGKLEEIRMKRDIVRETFDKDRSIKELKSRNEAAEKQRRIDVQSHDDFQTTFAEEFKKLNASGERLSDDKLAEYKATAQQKAEDRLLERQDYAQELAKKASEQQRKNDETEVIASGEYNDELARLLLNPDFKNDPDIQQTAMDAAILKMQGRKATEATQANPATAGGESQPNPAAEATDGTGPGTEAASAKQETEADATAQYADALKTLNIDINTKAGQDKLAAIATLFKTLTGDEVKMDGAVNDEALWKKFVKFLGSVAIATAGALVVGAGQAASDAIPAGKS